MSEKTIKKKRERGENAFIGTNSRTVKCNRGKSVVFLSCFCIKQIRSIRRFHACCRVSLQQVRKSLTNTGVPRVPLFLFLPHLTSYGLIYIKINGL